MARLTIYIDDDVLEKASRRALEQGTSVDSMIRGYLTEFAGTKRTRPEAVRNLLALAARSTAAGAHKRIARDDIHER